MIYLYTHLAGPAVAAAVQPAREAVCVGRLLRDAVSVGGVAECAGLGVGVWGGHAVLRGAVSVGGLMGLIGLVGVLSPWGLTLGQRMRRLRQMLCACVCVCVRSEEKQGVLLEEERRGVMQC